jgi:hypothetical protein
VANDNKEGNSWLNVSIGQGVDAALGNVIRGLLEKPAEEVGNLLSDSIGILSDRVKLKRALNAKLGFEKVRAKLEARNVDMKNITPPTEEELHLLVNGLSLSDDENVRDMWAGLFAKALEPDSDVTAERPFISVLQSLSPIDAKIIDFLSFTMKTERELQNRFVRIMPQDLQNITAEEKEGMEKAQKENMELRNNAIRSIEHKAEEYDLCNPAAGWAENLMRQGVIERTPLQQSNAGALRLRSLDERAVLQGFEQLNRKFEYMDQSAKRKSLAPEKIFLSRGIGSAIQLEVQLSGFGRRLAEACGVL